MKGNEKKGLIVLGLTGLIFTAVAFLIPVFRTGSFWAGYFFGLVAIVAQIYVFKIAFIEAEEQKSRFYGLPILKIGIIYLVIQLICSIVEMALGIFIPLWLSILINIIIGAVSAIGLIVADAARVEITAQEDRVYREIKTIKHLKQMSLNILSTATEKDDIENITKFNEELKYSDPVSNDDTKELEDALEKLMKELEESIISKNGRVSEICRNALICLKNRNEICKTSKK